MSDIDTEEKMFEKPLEYNEIDSQYSNVDECVDQKTQSIISLDQLAFNQKAKVMEVNSESTEVQCRLLTLGLYSGVIVEVLRQAPLGDPLQVRSGATLLSIRRSEAKTIRVNPI